nr:uncharacterized protein LOC111428904 [Onthophagus taurus]
MGFKVVLVLGVLALISGCTAGVISEEAAKDSVPISPPKPSGLLKEAWVAASQNMDSEMLSNVLSSVQLAVESPNERPVSVIHSNLKTLYPDQRFNILEYMQFIIHGSFYAAIDAYDQDGNYRRFVIFD